MNLELIDFNNLRLSKIDLSHNFNMKYNSMNMIECGIMSYYLVEIKLKNNSLSKIFIDILNDLESHRSIPYDMIDLSDNNIEWLPEILFNADFLDLSRNTFKKINGNAEIKIPRVITHLNLMQSISIDLNRRLDCSFL